MITAPEIFPSRSAHTPSLLTPPRHLRQHIFAAVEQLCNRAMAKMQRPQPPQMATMAKMQLAAAQTAADLATATRTSRFTHVQEDLAAAVTEGGGALYLSFTSVLSQVFLVLSQALLIFFSGFSSC